MHRAARPMSRSSTSSLSVQVRLADLPNLKTRRAPELGRGGPYQHPTLDRGRGGGRWHCITDFRMLLSAIFKEALLIIMPLRARQYSRRRSLSSCRSVLGNIRGCVSSSVQSTSTHIPSRRRCFFHSFLPSRTRSVPSQGGEEDTNCCFRYRD